MSIIPTIINNEGMIEYATKSIGKIVKVGSGISENSTSYTVNLYKNINDKLKYVDSCELEELHKGQKYVYYLVEYGILFLVCQYKGNASYSSIIENTVYNCRIKGNK